MKKFNHILEEAEKIIDEKGRKEEKLEKICRLLKENVPYYNWVGIYYANSDKKELTLGPFVGEKTEHVKIKFGSGICGQAAEKLDTIIVQDVSKESNYLSCSPFVKAEIVVPIFKEGKFVGELDIDSHMLSPFSKEDKDFLEEICKMLSKIF